MTSVFAKKALLPEGWRDDVRLQIDDGLIGRVEVAAATSPGDASVSYLVPGLCNAHSHAFQRALAGHTEERSPLGQDNFWTWRERMYALADSITAERLAAIARQAYCEMLVAGYTSVVEFHYLHRDPSAADAEDVMLEALLRAAADSGIRLTYVPVLYERAGFNDPVPEHGQRHFAMRVESFLEHYRRAAARRNRRLKVGIGGHSLRAVSPEALADIVAAAKRGSPLHIHIAEQQREVDQCIAAYGRRPIRWLMENFRVDGHWCLVHATHMDFDETAALAKSGAVVALCPSTEANLGDGLFPLHDYLKEGGRIAIGSDSHISINPFEELRWLEYGQRLATGSRHVAALRETHVGSELFLRVLEGGAQAAGMATVGIRSGAPADVIALSDDDPMLAGHDDDSRLDALVFSGYPLPIERVMVDGEWRVVEGRHVHRDEARSAFAATLGEIGGAS